MSTNREQLRSLREAAAPGVADVVAAAAAADLAESLRRHPSGSTRQKVADSFWLSRALARRLAASRTLKVRIRVAANPSTPPDALTTLTTDPMLGVRQAAAENPATPYSAAVATEDGDSFAHPGTPGEVLVAALGDRDRSDAAMRHPNLPASARAALLADPTSSQVRLWNLLENPSTTHTEALAVIARDSTDVSRWKWSEHPAADPAWLADVADACFDSSDQGTIARIARNPSTPPEVLVRIVAGHAHRDYVLDNPACPVDILLGEARRTPQADPRVSSAGYLTRCHKIAAHPAATREVLAELSGSRLGRTHRYRFALIHGRSATHAQSILELANGWPGTLADLVDVADAVCAPTD